MKLLISPISGEKFPKQLYFCLQLCEANIKPDLILCSSGGCLSTILASFAQWDKDKLYKICEQLSSDHFFEKRFFYYFNMFFSEYVFNVSNEGKKFFLQFLDNYTENFNTMPEFWIGTYNKCKQTPTIFHTKNDFLNFHKKCCDLINFDIKPIHKDDRSTFFKAIFASCTIPGLVRPENMSGNYHEDGGLFSASPVTLLSGCIEESFEEKELHIVYLNSRIFTETEEIESGRFLKNFMNSVTYMIRSSCAVDLNKAFNIFQKRVKKFTFHEFNLTSSNLKLYEEFIKDKNNSFLEIVCKDTRKLNLPAFKKGEICKLFKYYEKNSYCKLYWEI